MSIRSDRWIRRMAEEHGMIEPFESKQVRDGVISYGVSSFGYDIRVGDEYKVFTDVHSVVVDPKNFDNRSFVDIKGSTASSRRTRSRWRPRWSISGFRRTCWWSASASPRMRVAASS
jgi:deoxycytidine triphosphate deaminase